MQHNPDIYLLYEYMDKLTFTIRLKVRLDEPVDGKILNKVARRQSPDFLTSASR